MARSRSRVEPGLRRSRVEPGARCASWRAPRAERPSSPKRMRARRASSARRAAAWEAARWLLVTGAGPVGLLAALTAAQDVRARRPRPRPHGVPAPKPDLVGALGGTYHSGSVTSIGLQPAAIIECTGVGQVIGDAVRAIGSGGIVCLVGVGDGVVVIGEVPPPSQPPRFSRTTSLSAASTPIASIMKMPSRLCSVPTRTGFLA